MSNEFYIKTGNPSPNAPGSSSAIRDEFLRIETGLSKLPDLAGNAGKVVVVSASGLALESTANVAGLAITGSTINSTPIGLISPNLMAATQLAVIPSAPLALPMILSEGAISGLALPVGQSHAASKDYVDQLVLGLATGSVSTATSSLLGTTQAYMGATSSFAITDFDSFSVYAVSALRGSVLLSGAAITYTAPDSSGGDVLTLTRSGLVRSVAISVLASPITTPTLTAPVSVASSVLSLGSSAFVSGAVGDAHLNSDFQVATDAVFANVTYSSMASTVNKTSWSVPVTANTTYYARVRYRSATNGVSSYGATVTFTTAATFFNYIATPAATPAAFGDPFEGGFYKGLLWNQLVQSTTSTLIGTGSKVFAVADMASIPLVYAGQTLEVRSRANPVNKMVGVVTGALGTNLTINVTSVGGSGTFTDWSVMARYRMIDAPKSSGENLSIQITRVSEAVPAACRTFTEGWLATLSMVAAGPAIDYPAAHWARSLVIGGRSDWFLDARDGVELSFRNLKPGAGNNYVTANRSPVLVSDYQNNGSYGDASESHGVNLNSSPAGVAYTTVNPGQTSAVAFITGGVEAYSMTTWHAAYVSISDTVNGSGLWGHHTVQSLYGLQYFMNGKTSTHAVRAVRRSII